MTTMPYAEWVRRQGHEGKTVYGSKREARQAARRSADSYSEPREHWNAYRCGDCRAWHVGHRRAES